MWSLPNGGWPSRVKAVGGKSILDGGLFVKHGLRGWMRRPWAAGYLTHAIPVRLGILRAGREGTVGSYVTADGRHLEETGRPSATLNPPPPVPLAALVGSQGRSTAVICTREYRKGVGLGECGWRMGCAFQEEHDRIMAGRAGGLLAPGIGWSFVATTACTHHCSSLDGTGGRDACHQTEAQIASSRPAHAIHRYWYDVYAR